MRRTFAVGILALGLLAFQGLSAYADFVPVSSADLSGSRTVIGSPGGIDATDGWGASYGGFSISWVISRDTTTGFWQYRYTISDQYDRTGGNPPVYDVPGTPPTDPTLSHWILEVSPDPNNELGRLIIPGSASFTYEGPQTWTQDPSPDLTNPGHNNGNSNLPVDLYGIRITPTPNSIAASYVFSFWSERQPVWGDFYAKDGQHDDILAVAWNSGITSEPTSGGPFIGYIPVPDTGPGGGGQIPEPSTLLLLTLGGCGVLASRLRRKP